MVSTEDNGKARVMVLRQSACSGDCHKCSGCGAVEQKLLVDAHNAVGAKVGEFVILSANSGPVLAAAAVLYILPLVLFLVGYLVLELLWQRGGLGGCGAFLLGLLFAVAYDRRVGKKKKTEYTITGFVPGNEV